MLYSTPQFLIFFCLVIACFYLIKNQTWRANVLLGSSILFYAWAGLFDSLIFLFVVIVSWACAYLAERFPAQKKFYIVLGIGIMTVHLFFWKYAAWLSGEIQNFFPVFLGGERVHLPLPVGISFFTLQGIAYLIDLYRGEAVLMSLREFCLFKSFFPQLIAGPIVRYPQLVPQLKKLTNVDSERILHGLSLFCLGFFKKVVIADRCSPFVDEVFAAPGKHNRYSLIVALLGYTAQIWADFSGYTDMGRGAAKMLGIELPENFFSPYLSAGPSEFWRRWHVTLSQWIRDYIYIPLGGGSGGFLRVMFTAMITMVISGLWHGANWTFLCWGLYHGALLVIERGLKQLGWDWSKGPAHKVAVVITFGLVMVGWMIFRVQSFSDLHHYVSGLLVSVDAATPTHAANVFMGLFLCLALQGIFYCDLRDKISWQAKRLARPNQKLLAWCEQSAWTARFVGVGIGAALSFWLIGSIIFRFQAEQNAFIYFQF